MNINEDNTSPLIKFNPGRDDGSSSSGSRGTMGTRPTADPKSAKSFKKVLGKDQKTKDKADDVLELSEAEEEEEIANVNEEEETTQKQAPLSLFDLSGSGKALKPADKGDSKFAAVQSQKSDTNAPIDPDAEESEKEIEYGKAVKSKKPESPFAMMSPKGANVSASTYAHTPQSAKIDSKKQNFTSSYDTALSDLSYVNPMALAAAPLESTLLRTEKPTLPPSNIQDIINQLVEKVTEIKDQGRTDTIITLKQPPTLAGANLVITGFDSAKKEFNISFENLTQAAKNMLDLRANQDALKLALEKKGYAVHIITTTTLIENRPIDTTPTQQQSREDSREGKKEEERQKRQNDRDTA